MKRNYKRDYEFQKKLNTKQAEEIESLKTQIDALISLCEDKDKIIYSVDDLRKELAENVEEIKKEKKEYNSLTNDLKLMKKVMNETVFKGRWRLVKFLIK